MKALVLAEKPSVGRELARVLDCNWSRKGYLEGQNYIVTWALGHLVTLAEPEDYDERFKKWDLNDLPMLPEEMKLKVIRETRDQFNVVKDLMNREDVGELVIATDAGREGELVARWIMIKGGWRQKPVKRLWISSQTDMAIKEGFAGLKPGWQYDNLFQAASCRAEADWIIGLNVTRALTCKFEARLNAGRVQTPTLAILVQREQEIENFIPRDYWHIRADFGVFSGLWQDKKNNNRISELSQAENILQKITGKSGKIRDVQVKPKVEHPPLAYDLTELQREANRRFGFSAKHTLSLTQSLYERHKLITYPRTDSRYITSDMTQTLLMRLQRIYIEPYKKLLEQLLKKPLNLGKHLVDDKKVRDHHAIIPTEQPVKLLDLGADERRVYDLIVRRFIAVLYPDYVYHAISMLTEVEGELFQSRGRIVKEAGWKSVQETVEESEEENPEQTLKIHAPGEQVTLRSAKMEKLQTKPPAHYTEATLLTAMESPGKFIEDEELRESIKAGGLGTPATRAEIIEKLIRSNYVERDGKNLIPTPPAAQLLQLVPDELNSPELTAKWELRLSRISQGLEKDKSFRQDIRDNAGKLIAGIKTDTRSFKITSYSDTKCPQCGKYMIKFATKLVCQDHRCGYEISEGGKEKNDRRSKGKQRFEDKKLVQQFGRDRRRQQGEETLGDLFDF